MRIPRGLWSQVVSFENLLQAAKATLAHGRRYRGEGTAYRLYLEERLLVLQQELPLFDAYPNKFIQVKFCTRGHAFAPN